MQAAARSSARLLMRQSPASASLSRGALGPLRSEPAFADPSNVNTAISFSTAAANQEAKRTALKNRPLSPFLSQKRPERSSTMSIGERMTLIVVGLVLLPAPEIAKMSLFMY